MKKMENQSRIIVLGLGMCLLAGCGQKENTTEEVHRFEKWNLTEEGAFTLQDGTVIDRWTNDPYTEDLYKTEDGEELLYVTHMVSPSENEVAGMAPLSEYPEELQEKVLKYWAQEEMLYDLEEQLEKAYADFCGCQGAFQIFTVHEIKQDFNPAVETDRYVGYLTVSTEPKEEHFDGGLIEKRKETLFDIQTGEVLDVWDLFCVEEDVAREKLALLFADADNTVSDEDVIGAIDQASMLFFQDYFEVWFPYGTWERQEFAKGFGFEYEKIADLLREDAIPKESRE